MPHPPFFSRESAVGLSLQFGVKSSLVWICVFYVYVTKGSNCRQSTVLKRSPYCLYSHPHNQYNFIRLKFLHLASLDSMIQLDRIIHGDCIEILQQIPDRSIDLVILDPPYWKVISEKWDYKWRTHSDYSQWCQAWLAEIARVIKISGSLYLFGYLRNLITLYNELLSLGFLFRQQIVIDKGIKAISGRATKGYKMFPNVTETLLFFVFDSKPFIKTLLKARQQELKLTALEINQKLGVKTNGGGMWSLYTGDNILAQVPTQAMWSKLQEILDFECPYEQIAPVFNIEMGITDVWTDISFYEEKRYHPTQKPVKLIERIIRASSQEGMIVLDPFTGSGSTALACRNLKRFFIGIEKEEKYFKIAEERIKNLSPYQS